METEQCILSLGKRYTNAKAALDFLYRRPFIDAIALEQELGVSRATAHNLIRELVRLGILILE